MTLDDARALDAADPLAPLRARFALPAGVLYLDGNSLGPPAIATGERLDRLVRVEWGDRLIRGWNEAGWAEAPQRVGALIAPIVGADEDEVVVADSTSVCLFKLLAGAVPLRPGAIAVEADSFPTDRYLADAVARRHDRPFRAVADATQAVAADVAVALLSHVDYRTGARLDMAALEARAAETGTLILWDLSHSAGAVPVALRAAGASLAVGCGYKYLNGGPGAPAFLYVRRELQSQVAAAIPGWWGHDQPFAFAADFQPAAGITRFLSGTPPVLGLAALEAGVRVMRDAAPAALAAKAAGLWSLLVDELGRRCPTLRLVTPTDPARRGSHASFAHPHALALSRALIAAGVIGDHRPPDLLRLGLTPLYLSYEDVWHAAERIAAAVAAEAWRDPRFAAGGRVP